MLYKEITSISNAKIKHLKSLANKNSRVESGQFLVENLTIILDAAKSGFAPKEIFLSEYFFKKKEDKIKLLLEDVPEIYIIDEKVNKSFSSLKNASGICAVYAILENSLDWGENVLYLDAISDPGNLGTILRTALAFGFTNIVLGDGGVGLYNPKVIQSAKDAIFKLNIVEDSDGGILENIKANYKIYATSLSGEDSVSDIDNENVCLVLGNETHGVDQGLLDIANYKIKIKMSDNIESLNVAISAGILMHEIWKNRK